MKRTATAVWTGAMKDGTGTLDTQSGRRPPALFLPDPLRGRERPFRHQSGGARAAAHAGCFAMQSPISWRRTARRPSDGSPRRGGGDNPGTRHRTGSALNARRPHRAQDRCGVRSRSWRRRRRRAARSPRSSARSPSRWTPGCPDSAAPRRVSSAYLGLPRQMGQRRGWPGGKGEGGGGVRIGPRPPAGSRGGRERLQLRSAIRQPAGASRIRAGEGFRPTFRARNPGRHGEAPGAHLEGDRRPACGARSAKPRLEHCQQS